MPKVQCEDLGIVSAHVQIDSDYTVQPNPEVSPLFW